MSLPLQCLDADSAGIDRIHELQQRNREAVALSDASQRIGKLKALERAILGRRAEIQAALWEDYRKPSAEVDLAEIYPIVSEARHAIRHLGGWMKERRVSSRLALFGSRSSILYQPKGVVLILAPWNFPFNLALGPLVSAVAAGNCVTLKPSELTPASAACMKRILNDLFDEREVAVIEGGVPVAEALLRKKFDHIFFTGSPAVGRLVMKAASEHLTSVTLELGGKSPVIVDRTASLAEAARKVAWGKFFNCGQICIAPDYLLVDENVSEEFLRRLRAEVETLGEESRGILVNARHGARVRRLLDSAVAHGAQILTGGGGSERVIPPTVLTGVTPDSPIMEEEIFGPVLPVLTYKTIEEACRRIEEQPPPLVLYLFSRDRAVVRDVLRRTRAGGTVVNHTLIHFYELGLPFGGQGESGFGRSHGVHGFEAFSNARAVLDQRLSFSAIDLLRPPYAGRFKKKLIELTLKWL